MIIRAATHDDVPAIAQVHVDTWRSTYQGIVPDDHLTQLSYEQRAKGWHQILNHAAETRSFTLVAQNELGQIVGFINAGVDRANDPIYQGELRALYILKPYQHQGIGRRLVQAVVERFIQLGFKSMQVWVLADNPACLFYHALGGQPVKEAETTIGGKSLVEVAYGWSDITNLPQSSICESSP